MKIRSLVAAALLTILVGPMPSKAASPAKADEAGLIQPAELAAVLGSPKAGKPVILQVGFRVLYEQAHIPGAEYVGAASEAAGLSGLRARVKKLPKDAFIVLYCGCCPWAKCPNIKPAYAALKSLGFSNVKRLKIAKNFGADWVAKGYPVAPAAQKP